MYLLNEDTICAPATTPGTGAISVIRVSGGEALSVVSSLVRCAPGREIVMAPGYSVRFGRIYAEDGSLLDEVLVSVFRAPHSYTGEDSAEISCHASKYIVDNVLGLLVEAGVRPAEPGEFTRRAYLNGKMDLAQAEAVADLIAARSAAAHHMALSQLKGGFSKELRQMRGKLLNIVSLMELELDFGEEEVEFADRSELDALVNEVTAHIGRLISSFRLGNVLKNGIPVAIVGETNTGKSSLLNVLLGEERAIVSDIQGTTRDTVEETMNVGGLMFRFIDTAGIRQTDEAVERIGIERTFRKLEEAAVVMVMSDAGRGGVPGGVGDVMGRLDASRQKVIFVLNKIDLQGAAPARADVAGSDSRVASVGTTGVASGGVGGTPSIFADAMSRIESECLEHGFRNVPVVCISAKTGEGLDLLRNALTDVSAEYSVSAEDTIVTNARHIDALTNAHAALNRVSDGLRTGLPSDLLSQDIREALYHLGSIVGEISTDEILGNIFKNFCIGK